MGVKTNHFGELPNGYVVYVVHSMFDGTGQVLYVRGPYGKVRLDIDIKKELAALSDEKATKLRAALKDLPETLVVCKYAAIDEDGTACYCVVGWLGHVAGVSDADLVECGSTCVNEVRALVDSLVGAFGLSTYLLQRLQQHNDSSSESILPKARILEFFTLHGFKVDA